MREHAMAKVEKMTEKDFFTEYGEANRFTIHEVVGKGSYGVVCSATDNKTGEKVAIKKITDVFEHVSDATRILREVKLLRVLKHPDIVEVKHIVLPPNPREYKDIFVIFELMETDLHQVIKANDDLTPWTRSGRRRTCWDRRSVDREGGVRAGVDDRLIGRATDALAVRFISLFVLR